MSNITSYIWLIVYLVGLGFIISFIYSIVEWFSKDRVLKQIIGKKCVVFLGKDAYYGRIVLPPRSMGGFEIMLDGKQIENPEALIAFLKENYEETGDIRFLKKAERLLEEFKRKNILPKNLTLEDIEINPWNPPSLVSKKIYPSQLGELHAIMIFKHMLSESELKKKWTELKVLYTAGFIYKFKRKVYSALAYIKDKLTAATTSVLVPIAGTAMPELKKTVEEAGKKALAGVGKLYDPLLENGIGRLVTVKVQDVEGETKYYQGVLKEYSDNYIYVLDVDYRLQMDTKFTSEGEAPEYPKTRVKLHNFRIEGKHLRAEWKENQLIITNIYNMLVKIEKAKNKETEIQIGKVLKPKESIRIEIPKGEVNVEYEISLEADIVWPRKRAEIIGLGDYPENLIKEVIAGKIL